MPKTALNLSALLSAALLLGGCADQAAPTATRAPHLSTLATGPTATFDSTGAWDTGFTGRITLSNPGTAPITGWTLKFKFNGNASAGSSVWGAGGSITKDSAGLYTITPNSWGGATIPAGGSVTIGYDGTGQLSGVNTCTLNGAPCSGTSTGSDTTAPTVNLTASPTAVTAAGNVTLSAAASDNVGVSKVEFYAGGTLLGTDTTAPYSWTDAVTSAQNGTRTYAARAFDAAGNSTSASASVTVNIGGTTPPPTSGFRRIAYFAQWGIYGRNYQVKSIDTSGTAATLTHINYAFGNVYNAGGTYKCDIVTRAESGNGDGGDGFADYGKSFDAATSVDGAADVWSQPLKGNFNQLKKLKAKYPNLKVLISLGGWTWSRYFSAAASTDASRRALVSSCIDLYIKGNLPVSSDGAGGPGAGAGVFDGIDIDWEYPGGGGLAYNTVSPADRQNFTLLLQEFRRQLDALRPGLLLTIAAPGGPDKIANQDPAGYRAAVDWVNIMTYDFRGAWDAGGPTNFHSNLYTDPNGPGSGPVKTYSVDTAVNAFLNAGMPANKIVVGVPFYGRGWTGVPNVNNGLYQSASGPARGTYEAGIEDYKVLKNAPGTVFRSATTGQMWKYDGATFWSYDDEQVIAAKMAYIRSRGLGGAMAWSLDGDDAQGTLAKAVANGLK
ncbi:MULTISPECIES: glycosyl hydrolase family 18 protein [unclassified Deinococcus]|uniref:glycosyl hydrolase family 18 protein n=1 Tax=unclassified Deinococcus TaxID=2623546 RepID=UPI0020C5EEDD|nr:MULTISPECIES: glycosyl hydrolase family 18 protein [unclassified Deinococcus]MDK2012008.1 glycosyl hydrolase family 18 protein [Deinococcus sp. 43]